MNPKEIERIIREGGPIPQGAIRAQQPPPGAIQITYRELLAKDLLIAMLGNLGEDVDFSNPDTIKIWCEGAVAFADGLIAAGQK